MGDRGSSKADTLVKVVLVFFISLLSFSVGTFVGKQVSDSEHRKIALEGEFKGEGREIASEKDEHGAAEPNKISEKEVASLTEEFVNKDGAEHGEVAEAHAADPHHAPEPEGYKTYARKTEGREIASDEGHDVKTDGHREEKTAEKAPEHGSAHEAAHDTEHAAAKPAEKVADKSEKVADKATDAAHHAVGKATDATHHVAAKIAEGKAPSDGEAEAPKAAPKLPSVAGSAVGKYTVQVASYADEKEAKDHAAKLKAKGFQAFYLAGSVKGKEWYRVLVGLFATAKTADEYKAQLLKDGGTKAAFVQKIVQ